MKLHHAFLVAIVANLVAALLYDHWKARRAR